MIVNLWSRQTFSVADQVLLSLANLIVAYLLLASVGVEIFGLYSFLMVMCNLVSGGFSSVIHGQMVLRIAGKRQTIKRSVFRSTFYLYMTLFSIFALLSGIVLSRLDVIPYFEGNVRAIAAAGIFCFLLSMFDLFRKYTYVLARQEVSVISTLVYFLLLISIFTFYKFENSAALFSIFALLSLCKLIAICVNYLCLKELFYAQKMKLSTRLNLLKKYWEQGRFSFLGMLTSWVQNQGITPLLLFFAGPLVVGYFNLARLLTVPVTVVNTGLINSALPRLREIYNKAGLGKVSSSVSKYLNINLILSAIYFVILFMFHYFGLLEMVFPDYNEVVVFLLVWSVVTVTILYRSWLTQQYVVALKFKFLLFVGLLSAAVTYGFIFILYFPSKNYYTVPVSVFLGEVFLLLMLLRQKSNILSK